MSAIMLTLNIIAAVALIATAYAGVLSPSESKYAVVAVMVFPACLIASTLLLLLDLIWWRRQAIIALASMLLCYSPIRDFCPLHIPKRKMDADTAERAFTLMTYNVYQFSDQNGLDPNTSNPQLDYIFTIDPDIVCIQEAEYMQPTIRNNITEGQIAEIQNRYKYVFTGSRLALLSKFPAEPLDFDFPQSQFRSGAIMGWRVNVRGTVINIFCVHLRSLAFSKDQKELFREVTDGEDINRSDLREVRHELMPLLYAAALERQQQVRLLEGYIRKFGGQNVIVCGDFNDPVGSYPLYVLEKDCDLRQVYADVGFGPTITYNANNFYFRIDHILYRGDFKPYSITRGDIKASDHYPLTATFVTDN